MSSRIKKLVTSFQKNNIDALLITNDTNIRYLTHFKAQESWLFVTPKKTYYITDFRYITEAKEGLKGVTVKQYSKTLYDTVFELAKVCQVKRIGFDERHVTLASFKNFKKRTPKGFKLCAANNLVESLREIKELSEIKLIRKALAIHEQAYKLLKRIVKPGKKESEILESLERFIRVNNVGFSFDPIVASGPNSCLPHAQVTSRKFRANDVVLVDMGIDFSGYKSDLTRMFFLGKIPNLVNEVNEKVFKAQRLAIEKIKSGATISEVDQAARGYLDKHKLAKYFGHALGHGVGLDIHEDPRMSHNNTATLKPGMIITVEPAVYIPKKFGIRIEDMVLVTKNGCEVISDHIY